MGSARALFSNDSLLSTRVLLKVETAALQRLPARATGFWLGHSTRITGTSLTVDETEVPTNI